VQSSFQQRFLPATAIKLAGDELLRQATAEWTPDSANAIHRTRVAIKRVRALLALMASDADTEHLDRQLQQFARSLASLRDQQVLIEAWQTLQESARPRFAQALDELEPTVRADFLQPVVRSLTDAAAQLTVVCEAWNRLPDADTATLIARLTESYRRCRRSFEALTLDAPADCVHRFRKRAKRLQYQVEFLVPIHPHDWTKLHARLQRLTDAAGRHHDWDLLRCRIAGVAPKSPARSLIEATLKKYQVAIVAQVLHGGASIFEDRPKRFRDHVERAWRDWPSPISPSALRSPR
jgi:CHAD domain-containing protein